MASCLLDGSAFFKIHPDIRSTPPNLSFCSITAPPSHQGDLAFKQY